MNAALNTRKDAMTMMTPSITHITDPGSPSSCRSAPPFADRERPAPVLWNQEV